MVRSYFLFCPNFFLLQILPRYMPLTWPLGHIGTAVSKPEEDKDIPKPSATPYLTLVILIFACFNHICNNKYFKVGHLTSMAAATRSWALAYLCIFHLPQQFGQVGKPAQPMSVVLESCYTSGLSCLWPGQRLQHGLDAFDCCSKLDCNLGHLWILGLVSILLTTPGEFSFSPYFYTQCA